MQELQTLGWYCSGSGTFCLECCLRKLYFSRATGSAKHHLWKNFELIIHCSPCILLGFVFIMAKVSEETFAAQSEENEKTYCYLLLEWTDTTSFAGKQLYPAWIFFFAENNWSTATENIRFRNTMSPVVCSTGKEKHSSRLSGSPTFSGFW